MVASNSLPSPSANRDPARLFQLGLLVASDTIWLIAWSITGGHWLTTSGGAPLVPAWTIILLLVGSTLGSRWLGARRTGRTARLGLSLLGLLLALIIGLAPAIATERGIDWSIPANWIASADLPVRPVATIALALVAWWRGLMIGQAQIALDDVETGFRRGVGALVLLALLNTVMPPAVTAPTAPLVWAAVGVLATGLLGMPLARLLDLRASSARTGVPALRLDRHWVGLLLATVGILLVGALVIVSILTFERLDGLFGWLVGPLDAALRTILTILLLPLALLLDAVITFLRQFVRPTPPEDQPTGQGQRGTLPTDWVVPTDMEWLLVAVRVVIVVGVLIAIVVFVAAALRRFADDRRGEEVDEERDFVWSWAAVRDGVRQWLRSLTRRRRAPAATPTTTATTPLLPRDRWGPRELYRALLRLGAGAGQPHAVAETPREYAAILSRVERLRPGAPAIDDLTDLYNRTRYGDETPAESEITDARAALTNLEVLATTPTETTTAPDKRPGS